MVYPVIVVLAYNRPKALQRLLGSLVAASYLKKPKLILSLEGGATPEVSTLARNFVTDALDVSVVEQSHKLGLRDHVIRCADLSLEFGSVIILEDDLVVDRHFYKYASEALQYYENEDTVAGVALYGYEYNELCGFPFRPMRNGYSSYPMQIACSSGQCWTRGQWAKFKAWYAGKLSSDIDAIEGLPLAVKKWPETSWKKYFHGYMVETNKYFIYPYLSYSTNCSDPGGAHIRSQSNFHQVCLASQERPPPTPRFCPVDNREVVYDAYMEPVGEFVYRALGLDRSTVEIDFYGIKPMSVLKKTRYVVTARKCSSVLSAYAYAFRPPEVNLSFPVERGEGMVWNLASTSALLEGLEAPASVARFSYFSGMRLMRRDLERVFVKTFFKRPVNRMRRFVKQLRESGGS
jgi:hypothetical protein